MTYILALRSGHNASACIGDQRRILFAIQEERLNREKNYWGFPRLAIRACLEAAGAKPADLAAVVCGERQVLSRYHSRDDILLSYRRHQQPLGRLRQRVLMPLLISIMKDYGQPRLRRLLEEEGLGDRPLAFYDHHSTHAAAAYYGLRRSPEKDYLVLTCDGSGDGLCASVRVMGGGRERVLATTPMWDSLGAIYAWVTYLLGFLPLEHEYKLMGMAPYASEEATVETAQIFHGYLGLDATGLAFKRKVPEPIESLSDRLERDLRGLRFDHICAGLQRFTEDLLVAWAGNAVRASGVKDVLAAGGVFMNVKANKRIAELPEVASFEAYPSCGDETLPMGAWAEEAARRFGGAAIEPLADFYLGDDLDPVEAERAVRASGFAFARPPDVAAAVAELLAAGHPVARCAGRMEFGARALGNRSILADPANPDVVRVINRMVKKRDFWMPFAPIVMEARQDEYIQNPKRLRSPFMMMTFDTRPGWKDLIAAVHGADLTCRAQILAPSANPAMHAILEAFSAKTGRGVLLNTSFNLHGSPIVRSAADALDVFEKSGLEHLLVGDWLVHRPLVRNRA